jgi:guanyl-specific ribonuclease Sa
MAHDVLESGVGQSAGRVITREDAPPPKQPAAEDRTHLPVGDEPLPNVHDNQRQTVDTTPLPPNVPPKAVAVVEQVANNGGAAPPGHVGGRAFMNDGRGGGQTLPTTDAAGTQITYREYDVNPRQPGVSRGAERVVIGSDGSAYYTNNHYTTFTRIKP